VIRKFLVIEMSDAGNKKAMVVLPRSVDCLLLGLKLASTWSVIFHHKVIDCATFPTALRRASM